ncbi:MAG: hypothetical protein JSV16_15535 [Candidatus Hydrogenedentota bacterium]|nr:MAG: hypothetical protein JSV16_15535 [Candidatus Hydrogenedentota bacterium]
MFDAPASIPLQQARPGKSTIIPAFLLLSFSTGLFFFGIFKILSFLFLPPVLLLLFMLCGFPIGGFLALKFFLPEWESFSRSLRLLRLVMVLTLAGYFVFRKLFSFHMPAEMAFTESLAVTMVSVIVQGLYFEAFFILYGLTEFMGYQVGMRYLGGNSKLIYALFLFGTALSYVFLRETIGFLGLFVTFGLAVAGISTILILIEPTRLLRRATEFVLILAISLIPGMEGRFVSAISTLDLSALSTHHAPDDNTLLYQGWSDYVHLILMENDKEVIGIYNGQGMWTYLKGLTRPEAAWNAWDYIPFSLLGPGKKVGVIGAGGAKQVREALNFGAARVDAVEIIPEVIDVVKNQFAEKFDRVYDSPRVRTFRMDGRKYLEGLDEPVDMIMLASTETFVTGMKTLYEPSQTLFTLESFKVMKKHLSPDGIVSIYKGSNVDRQGNLVRLYSKGLKEAGFNTNVYYMVDREPQTGAVTGYYSLILGRNNPQQPEISPDLERWLFANNITKLPHESIALENYEPIVDDKPFSISAYVNQIRPGTLEIFGALLFVLVFLIGAAAVRFLKKQTGERFPAHEFHRVCLLAVLVGANFMILENFVIFKLYRYLAIPLDAIFLGTVGFLMITGLGSVSASQIPRIPLITVGAALCGVSLLAGPRLSTPATLLVFLPLVGMTGSFFPSIFIGTRERLLSIFVMDAIGALVGGLISFFVPIFFGFNLFFFLTPLVFLLCSSMVLFASPEPAAA